jgi:hypothetical protein
VCFSPEGDLVGGLVVTAIGIDACRHVRGRLDHRLLAAFPLLLGAHQLTENYCVVGSSGCRAALRRPGGHVDLSRRGLCRPADPGAADHHAVGTDAKEEMEDRAFLAVGLGVSLVLLEAMVRTHPTVHLGAYHLSYTIGLHHGIAIIGLYIVATCGSLLASGFRDIVYFGLANVVAVVILARLSADGFASLWCFYAALASGAIVLHMRYAKPHRHMPELAV